MAIVAGGRVPSDRPPLRVLVERHTLMSNAERRQGRKDRIYDTDMQSVELSEPPTHPLYLHMAFMHSHMIKLTDPFPLSPPHLFFLNHNNPLTSTLTCHNTTSVTHHDDL